jgi:hypothetical protein
MNYEWLMFQFDPFFLTLSILNTSVWAETVGAEITVRYGSGSVFCGYSSNSAEIFSTLRYFWNLACYILCRSRINLMRRLHSLSTFWSENETKRNIREAKKFVFSFRFKAKRKILSKTKRKHAKK